MPLSPATPLDLLEHRHEFISRHIGISAADERHMLSVVGAATRQAQRQPLQLLVRHAHRRLAQAGGGKVQAVIGARDAHRAGTLQTHRQRAQP